MAIITAAFKADNVSTLAGALIVVENLATAQVIYKTTVRPDGVEYSALVVYDDTGSNAVSSSAFAASTPEDLATLVGTVIITSKILYQTTVKPDGVEYSAIVLEV